MRMWSRALFTVAALLCTLLPSVPTRAQVLRQVTDFRFDRMSAPEMCAAGTETFVITDTDPLGTNPQRAFQVFSFDSLTGVPSQITPFALGVEYLLQGVSVTGDGRSLAFAARGDLAGNNADGSPEVFILNRDSGEIVQLTDDATPNAGSIQGLAMAAGGTRVVFVSTSDPLGTNPDGHPQVFLAEADGSGVAQLTSLTGSEISSLGIDGAGGRIVFDLSDGPPSDWSFGASYAIEGDGSGERALGTASEVRLSADGSTIVFETQGPSAHSPVRVQVQDWAGTSSADILGWGEPGVSGDALYVFGAAVEGTISIRIPGDTVYWSGVGGWGDLVPPPPESPAVYVIYDDISVSGDGSQVALTRRFGSSELAELSLDLLTVAPDGEPLELMRLFDGASPMHADIACDGSVIALTGRPSYTAGSLYAVHPDGTALLLDVGSVDYFEPPLVSPDGQTIYFIAGADLRAVGVDGANPRTIASVGSIRGPQISADGSVLVFEASGEIYAAGPDGSAAGSLGIGTSPRVDAAGSWVVFASEGSIYRVSASGAVPPELVSPDNAGASSPDISADGSALVYVASGDPLGLNPDLSDEIFHYATSTGTTTQLTAGLGGELSGARISPDGAWVYFTADVRLDEDDPDVFSQVFRVHVDSGKLQRWFGLGFGERTDPRRYKFVGTVGDAPTPAVELDGSGRSVFVAAGNLGGDNLGQLGQLWLADPAALNAIRLSGPAPTRLDWDVDPRFLRYDVVRGNLEALRGGSGLGDVVCLRNDSPFPTTRGSEDVEDPAPGSAFFYVYRGSYGLNLGSEAYGQSSSGVERHPGSGDCPE